MLNGLDLFTGIGGITLALKDWVRPIAYCEKDLYCQQVLLSRMADESLPNCPIWDDVTTLDGNIFKGAIDIVYGGFPCQDISVAGLGKGLAGERSGLFYEIVRLCRKIEPRFIFLENVPAITTRGGTEVVREIAAMGYDCRWCVISAASVGAFHRRERWFLLAHSKHNGASASPGRGSVGESFTPRREQQQKESFGETERANRISSDVAYTKHQGLQGQGGGTLSAEKEKFICSDSDDDGDTNSITSEQTDKGTESIENERRTWGRSSGQYWPFESREHWQEVVSGVCRTSDGLPNHVDRLRGLGNSVVPQQVKEAFKILVGL